MNYLLTMKDGTTKQVSAVLFHNWVKSWGERIGDNFEARLDQFRHYTGLNVKDWEMIDL